MKEYTMGKKAAAILIHQLFIIVMTAGIYAVDYCINNRLYSQISVFTITSIIGLACSFVALAYLTNVTGRKSQDDPTIYYNFVDKIYSDILLVIFTIVIVCICFMSSKVGQIDFSFSELIIAVGTLAYIMDIVFLTFYHSIVRKVKGNILVTHSLAFKIFDFLRSLSRDSGFHITTRNARENKQIKNAIEMIATGALNTRLDVEEFHGQNKELAEAYINFMLSEEPAVANALYTYYASPNRVVRENAEYKEEMEGIMEGAYELMYDTANVKATAYKNLPGEQLALINNLWEELKSDIKISPLIYVLCAVIVVALASFGIFFAVRKKIRNHY